MKALEVNINNNYSDCKPNRLKVKNQTTDNVQPFYLITHNITISNG